MARRSLPQGLPAHFSRRLGPACRCENSKRPALLPCAQFRSPADRRLLLQAHRQLIAAMHGRPREKAGPPDPERVKAAAQKVGRNSLATPRLPARAKGCRRRRSPGRRRRRRPLQLTQRRPPCLASWPRRCWRGGRRGATTQSRWAWLASCWSCTQRCTPCGTTGVRRWRRCVLGAALQAGMGRHGDQSGAAGLRRSHRR